MKLVRKFEEWKEDVCRVRPGRLVENLYQEALEVSAALRVQRVLQGDVVFLQIHFLYRLQVDLWVHGMLVTSQESNNTGSTCGPSKG